METKIEHSVEDGMRDLWESCCSGYQPSFRGEKLGVECCDPETSLKNLLGLLAAGLQPKRYWANKDRSILIEFDAGMSYLATGFSFGEEGPATAAFAQFATKAHGDRHHYDHLRSLDVGMTLAEKGGIMFDADE